MSFYKDHEYYITYNRQKIFLKIRVLLSIKNILIDDIEGMHMVTVTKPLGQHTSIQLHHYNNNQVSRA